MATYAAKAILLKSFPAQYAGLLVRMLDRLNASKDADDMKPDAKDLKQG